MKAYENCSMFPCLSRSTRVQKHIFANWKNRLLWSLFIISTWKGPSHFELARKTIQNSPCTAKLLDACFYGLCSTTGFWSRNGWTEQWHRAPGQKGMHGLSVFLATRLEWLILTDVPSIQGWTKQEALFCLHPVVGPCYWNPSGNIAAEHEVSELWFREIRIDRKTCSNVQQQCLQGKNPCRKLFPWGVGCCKCATKAWNDPKFPSCLHVLRLRLQEISLCIE